MANEQNLIPFTSDQNREEAAKNGRKGGVASGAARRRKRSMREAADLFLSLPVSDQTKWNKIAEMGVEPGEIDNQMAMIIGLTAAATNGDAKAAKVIVELLGEAKPEPYADMEIEDDPLSKALMEEAAEMEREAGEDANQ